ncbi:hypothetical protein [Saccharopolyspora pogona]|uniref:hypothetical protein n=1 Tax=Saccharopolyspora pogona TaxID=333966 RepID=UPI0016883B7F|nr:hypothetical protein [Saccharopolyspora pogona]
MIDGVVQALIDLARDGREGGQAADDRRHAGHHGLVAPKPVGVHLGQSEQVADHPDRQQAGAVADQVEAAALDRLVQQFVGDVLDPLPVLRHADPRAAQFPLKSHLRFQLR